MKSYFALALVLSSLFAGTVWATTTVYPSNQGQGQGGALTVTANTVYYPAIQTTGAPLPFVYFPPGGVPDNFVSLDIGSTAGNESLNYAVFLQVSSTISGNTTAGTTTPTTSTTPTYIIVTTGPTAPGTTLTGQFLVPIAWTAQTGNTLMPCATSNNTNVNNCHASNGNYGYAAYMPPGATIEIAIFPLDICSPQTSGDTMVGCGGANTAPTLSSTGLTTLNIDVIAVQDSNAEGNSGTQYFQDFSAYAASGTQSGVSGDTPVPVNISLQSQANTTATCPATTGEAVNGLYLPGDQQIFINTGTGANGFSLNTTVSPAAQVLAFGNYSTSPNTAVAYFDQADFKTGNSIIDHAQLNVVPSPPQISGGASFGGFKDSTKSEQYYYTLGLAILDAASFVDMSSDAPTGASSPGDTCVLYNAQATQINGFLNQNACFIANAAFEDKNAGPVQMLREFRDAILVPSPRGRQFVHWYYHWSPPAARWLRAHRYLRPLVLLALVPVEMIAWSALHPAGFFLVLCLLSLSVLCLSLIAYRRRVARAGSEEAS